MFYKAAQGTTNHLAGLAAEHSVIAEYAGRAHHVLAHRWRGDAGEIDLIFDDGDGLIFTEVKKSRSHDAALRNLSRRQQKRLYQAATEYLANTGRSLATEMRFDVALVDGQGHIQVMENAMIQ